MVSCRIVIFVIISKIKIGLKSCQVGAHMVVWVDGVKYVHSLGANILSAFAVRDGDDCGAGRRGRVAGRGGVSLCPVDVRLSEAIQTEPNKGMSCRLPITRVDYCCWGGRPVRRIAGPPTPSPEDRYPPSVSAIYLLQQRGLPLRR